MLLDTGSLVTYISPTTRQQLEKHSPLRTCQFSKHRHRRKAAALGVCYTILIGEIEIFALEAKSTSKYHNLDLLGMDYLQHGRLLGLASCGEACENFAAAATTDR